MQRSLRPIKYISMMIIVSPIILQIASRIEGKPSVFLPYIIMFALGLIGLQIHRILADMDKRLSMMEKDGVDVVAQPIEGRN